MIRRSSCRSWSSQRVGDGVGCRTWWGYYPYTLTCFFCSQSYSSPIQTHGCACSLDNLQHPYKKLIAVEVCRHLPCLFKLDLLLMMTFCVLRFCCWWWLFASCDLLLMMTFAAADDFLRPDGMLVMPIGIWTSNRSPQRTETYIL